MLNFRWYELLQSDWNTSWHSNIITNTYTLSINTYRLIIWLNIKNCTYIVRQLRKYNIYIEMKYFWYVLCDRNCVLVLNLLLSTLQWEDDEELIFTLLVISFSNEIFVLKTCALPLNAIYNLDKTIYLTLLKLRKENNSIKSKRAKKLKCICTNLKLQPSQSFLKWFTTTIALFS